MWKKKVYSQGERVFREGRSGYSKHSFFFFRLSGMQNVFLPICNPNCRKMCSKNFENWLTNKNLCPKIFLNRNVLWENGK